MVDYYNNFDPAQGDDGDPVFSMVTENTGDPVMVFGNPVWSTVPSKQIWEQEGVASVLCAPGDRLMWQLGDPSEELPAWPLISYTYFYAAKVSPISGDAVVAWWELNSNPNEHVELKWLNNGTFELRYTNVGVDNLLWTSVPVNPGVTRFLSFDVKITTDEHADYPTILIRNIFGDTLAESGDIEVAVGAIPGYMSRVYFGCKSGTQKVQIDELMQSTSYERETIGVLPPTPIPYDFNKVFIQQVTGSTLDYNFILDVSKLDMEEVKVEIPASSVNVVEALEENENRFLSPTPATGTINYSEWVNLEDVPVVRAAKGARIEMFYQDERFESSETSPPYGIKFFVGIVRDCRIEISSENNEQGQVKQITNIQLGDISTVWTNELITLPSNQPEEGAITRLEAAIGYDNVMYRYYPSMEKVANQLTAAYTEPVTRTRLEWIQEYTRYTGMTTLLDKGYRTQSVYVTDSTIKFPEGSKLWQPSMNVENGEQWQTAVEYMYPVAYASKVFPTRINVVMDYVIYTDGGLPGGALGAQFGPKPGSRVEVPSGEIAVIKSTTITLTPKHMAVSAELSEPLDYGIEYRKFTQAARNEEWY